MDYKISLVVDGVSLDDESVLSVIESDLTDLMWSQVGGRTLATVFVEEHPVLRSLEAARRVTHSFPSACVHRVDREIVGTSEIAERASVTSEAVRLWVAGKRGPKNFPAPAGQTGGGRKGPTQLWYWGDVNAWLDNHYRLGDGHRYLSDRQHAQLVERLTRPSMGGAGFVVGSNVHIVNATWIRGTDQQNVSTVDCVRNAAWSRLDLSFGSVFDAEPTDLESHV